MTKRSTIYEVARRSGVSTATVSRVMSNRSGYSPATRERVLRVAAELGWRPSGSARGLATRRAGIIGLLFSDLGHDDEAGQESPLYIDRVIRGAEMAADEAGQAILIAATRGSSGRERAVSLASRVDGLVVVARSLPRADVAALAQRLPVVMLSDHAGRDAKIDSIGVDNAAGIRAVVEHLSSAHGLRDIAFVAGPQRSPDARERFAGFRRAMQLLCSQAAHEPDALGDFTEAGGADAVRDLLGRRTMPEALVCANDQMAIGVLGVLAELGARVPDDVAVTGFDDIAVSRHIRPLLTTVAQPMRDIGAAAVRMVLNRLDEPSAPRNAVVLPTQLVVRRSCGCLPIGEQTPDSRRTAA